MAQDLGGDHIFVVDHGYYRLSGHRRRVLFPVMATPDEITGLKRVLGAAGRAHHEVFGGPNPGWPEWYSKFMLDNGLGAELGFEPPLDQVVGWLVRADAIHRSDAPDEHWPGFYAGLILGWIEDGV